MTRYRLTEAATVTLDASGAGTVEIGPDRAGPAQWHITGVILRTDRPGEAPVPRAEIWLDQMSAGGLQGGTYDGSFAQGRTDLTISRGQRLIVRWAGGKAGDAASVTVTGEKW